MNKTERIAFFSLAVLVWIYLGLRSIYVPFIHDETITYFAYIQDATFIPPWSYWDANNHLLNSALSALFHAILGTSPFVIRLASWLSFIPFIYFIFKFSEELEARISRWTFIIPLLFTPFLIEFFSLTRGYGMSVAWFLGTLYYTYKFTQTTSSHYIKWISILGLLSTLSNLSVIVAVFIVYGWVLLIQLFVQQKPLFQASLKWFGIFMIPQLPLIYYVLLLKERDLLYYGGADFVENALKPFSRFFFNSKELWWLIIIPFSIFVILYGIEWLKLQIKEILVPKYLFFFVLLLSVIAVFAQHFLTGVNYPEDRAALYFFPLLIGALSWLSSQKSKTIQSIALILVIWFPVDFVSSANISYSKLWKHEHVPYRFNKTVNSLKSKEGYPPTVNGYFLRQAIWNFNQLNTGKSVSAMNIVNHPSQWADVLMIDSVRISEIDQSDYKLLDYDPISGNSLLKRKQPRVETIVKDTNLSTQNIADLYTGIFDFNANTLSGNPYVMYFNLDTESNTSLMHTYLICSLSDTTGTEIFSNKFFFSQVNENWTNEKNWKIKLFLPPFPANAGRFKAFIHNPKLETHRLPKIEASLVSINPPEK